jgi:hypothetical protein
MFDQEDEDYVVGGSALTFEEEYDLYLHDPTEVPPRGVIAWWLENAKKYPILSRIALDYHTIPGMSPPFHAFVLI